MKQTGVLSPKEWGLPVSQPSEEGSPLGVGVSSVEIDRRIRANLYQWLPRQFDAERGAYCGYYRASDGYREPPQTVNLIASWELLAAYDRYGHVALLERACQALDFYYRRFVISHPMSVVAGGAQGSPAGQEIWTKFSAEFAMSALGCYRRSGKAEWLERATQSGRYLQQAARHGFSPRYRFDCGSWCGTNSGWDSWGRAIEACLDLEKATGDQLWYQTALRWGEHALAIQAQDGCFYLIDRDYYNTDLAADELRGLFFLHERTGDERFLEAGVRFADWHVEHQRPDGAWPLTIDADGNVVIPTVGPGDVPNIAVALLAAHRQTGRSSSLDAASKAFRYSLSMQVLPGSGHPLADDPNVQWGFWSWDPHYDFTVSADQSTHHVRGMMFLLDYSQELERSAR